MKKLLLFIPIIIFISSCTITKRVHRPGYYISSNKNIKASTKKAEAKPLMVEAKIDSTTLASNKQTKKTKLSLVNKPYSYQTEKAEVQKVKVPVLKAKKKTLKKHIYSTNNKTKPQEIKQKIENGNKTTNGYGLASFILGILSFVTFGITGLFAVSFGLKAMKQHKMNPDKYKNKWMPILGYILGIITTFLMSFWILIAAIWEGSVLLLILVIALAIFAIVSLINIP